jgi:hypothetical protein
MMMACKWGDDCGLGYYCLAPGCNMGSCVVKPPAAGASPDEAQVCGCDGNTYYNGDIAAASGVSVKADGACAGIMTCDPATPCPGTLKCNREVADKATCSPNVTGKCLAVPVSCPLDGPKARACSNNTCELKCSLIQSQNPWFEDATCN